METTGFGVVTIGSTVRVRDDMGRVKSWRIVAPHRGLVPTQGRMAADVPLARALLDHGPGEQVAVVGAGGPFYVTIEQITAA